MSFALVAVIIGIIVVAVVLLLVLLTMGGFQMQMIARGNRPDAWLYA